MPCPRSVTFSPAYAHADLHENWLAQLPPHDRELTGVHHVMASEQMKQRANRRAIRLHRLSRRLVKVAVGGFVERCERRLARFLQEIEILLLGRELLRIV